MSDRNEDAQLGLLGQAAYALTGPASSPPPVVPGLVPNWRRVAYITATDELFRAGAFDEHLYYGYLAESVMTPGEFIVAIRGTSNPLEWAKDAEFALRAHPSGGHVESGFDDIYNTMLLDGKPIVGAVAAIVGTGSVTVIGHSLGAAIAIYLTRDLAAVPGLKVRGRFYAPPHPGDIMFANLFDKTVADYMCYAYELDAVPRMPFGLGYSRLAKYTSITPKTSEALVKFDLGCHHYLWCYISMLKYSLTAAAKLLVDPYAVPSTTCPDCIRGPRPAATVVAD